MSHSNDLPLNLRIGIEQELFFFDEMSPGSAFFLPNGTKIYNRLISFIRNEYYIRGFDEVITPMIAKKELWEVSGHLEKYKKNMFKLENKKKVDQQDDQQDNNVYYLKPMQCPLHCIIFRQKSRSYKDLPIRLADFGCLHRNEMKGSLTSLFRNRKFEQDDAHIFCTKDQLDGELINCLNFITDVYDKFGFRFEVGLSTRPEEFVGEIELWNFAEDKLRQILDNSQFNWHEEPFNGAFYGPKIDIQLTDSLGRNHQCATIQLDFQLPSEQRFNLSYIDCFGEKQVPVMIHRAIYGSFERFIALLCEHYGGKWPLWLNPKQIILIPTDKKVIDYVNNVYDTLKAKHYYVDVDLTDHTFKKKIANAQLKQYNYIVVIGEIEKTHNNLNIRHRDTGARTIMTLDDFVLNVTDNLQKFN